MTFFVGFADFSTSMAKPFLLRWQNEIDRCLQCVTKVNELLTVKLGALVLEN
jgi:hypothetical protein